MWLQCCQAKLLPSGVARFSPSIQTPAGQALLAYAGLMLGLGLVQAVTGIMRHRFAVTNWLTAAYRTVQLVGRQAVHLGGTLPRKVSTGEVVAALYERGVVVRELPGRNLVRASCGWWTSEGDLERLAEGVAAAP